jgi:hypothetical protein
MLRQPWSLFPQAAPDTDMATNPMYNEDIEMADASLVKPNLFIVGAMKSGTSSMHAILGTHPEIFMCEPKEPCYFVDSEVLRTRWADMYDQGYWRSEQRYLSLFKDGRGFPVVGESSTYYSKRPQVTGVAERIHQFNAEAKILYLMRDPVERTISHYWHRVRKKGELRDIGAAIRADPYYTEISHYAMQLEPYLRLFGREQVHAMTVEGFDNDMAGQIAEVFRWLGVDDSYLPSNINERKHATVPVVEQQRLRLPHGLRERSSFRRFLKSVLPAPVQKKIRRLIYREVDRKSVGLGEVIAYLRSIQLKQTEELEALLSREFHEWDTLYSEEMAPTADVDDASIS